MTAPSTPGDHEAPVTTRPPGPPTTASLADGEAREKRRQAEAIYAIVIQDLRFADAKAGFIVVLAGTWCGAVNAAVPLTSPARSVCGQIMYAFFGASTLMAIGLAVWAIVPKNTRNGGDLHHVRRLAELRWRIAPGRRMVDHVKSKLGDHAKQEYDDSLILDLVRVGERCDEKYFYVRGATIALLVAIGLGAVLIVSNAKL